MTGAEIRGTNVVGDPFFAKWPKGRKTVLGRPRRGANPL
jgi:hypothetical protein